LIKSVVRLSPETRHDGLVDTALELDG